MYDTILQGNPPPLFECVHNGQFLKNVNCHLFVATFCGCKSVLGKLWLMHSDISEARKGSEFPQVTGQDLGLFVVLLSSFFGLAKAEEHLQIYPDVK